MPESEAVHANGIYSKTPYNGNYSYIMDTCRTQLLKELHQLSLAFCDNNTLLLKKTEGVLHCQFLYHGLANTTVTVKSSVLAQALWHISSLGIIEGADYLVVKNGFSKFCLHVKTLQLYAELSSHHPALTLAPQNLLVA
ncbi:hypothetical protein [Pontibacter arcticus]|uniref:Uncharacterized protein n=1 Tax=Pontibacter arcticus TaxID=2080288 RepID=A0A364RF40_9BACT|nr:hypothetical protein [Pontibacter arcticus]RAU82903.1 hypothetical protein DP923_06555 [Pontibacter arcticus]